MDLDLVGRSEHQIPLGRSCDQVSLLRLSFRILFQVAMEGSAMCFTVGVAKTLGSWQPFCHHEAKARLRGSNTEEQAMGTERHQLSVLCCELKIVLKPGGIVLLA